MDRQDDPVRQDRDVKKCTGVQEFLTLTKASWWWVGGGHYLGQSAQLNESQQDRGVSSSESHWLDL